jgi:hypothetical protein
LNKITGDEGAWGWNIDLSTVDLSQKKLTCDLYAGAAQCDLAQGRLVGQLQIAANSIAYNFSSGYGGKEIHLYGGPCAANDGGNSIATGTCNATDVEQNARVPGKYTYVTPTQNPLVSYFVLDKMNQNGPLLQKPWSDLNFSLFPLQSKNNSQYLSAHTTVCSCGTGCAPPSRTNAVQTSQFEPTVSETGSTPVMAAATATILAAAAVLLVGAFAYKRYATPIPSGQSVFSSAMSMSMASASDSHLTSLLPTRHHEV